MNLKPGAKLVGTWEPRPRRLSEYELRQLSHDARLQYAIENPMTEAEREQAFLREDEIERFELHGELIVNSRLWDDGPIGPDGE